VNVQNEVHDQNSQEEKQVFVPSPEMKIVVLNVSSENAKGNTVEPEDHYFLDTCAQVKRINSKSGCNEYPQ
jgi:hypothetical protein